MSTDSNNSVRSAFKHHPRTWRDNRYVYPVCSRRSGGISIGVNLNPDKVCNFGCAYCQVDRRARSPLTRVELSDLRAELEAMLAEAQSGRLARTDPFAQLPEPLRQVRDIAFSGDGEPTTCPVFVEAVQLAVELRRAAGLEHVGLVLITNGTMFHQPRVREGLELLAGAGGQVWAKLDAGSEASYRKITRTAVPLARVVGNLIWAAGRWPIVVQSCFFRLAGEPPPADEVAAYCDRLAEIMAGGRIRVVQAYTVARAPADGSVSAMTAAELEAVAAAIRQRFPELPVRTYPA